MRDKVPLPVSPLLDPAVRERIADRDRQAARARPSATDYEARAGAAGWRPAWSLVARLRSFRDRLVTIFSRRKIPVADTRLPSPVDPAVPDSFVR